MTADQLCREALRLLEDALQKPPAELKAEVDVAEAAVADLRDELISRLRAGDSSVRSPLDDVNVALSLLVGVEYPAGGIQRQLVQQAQTALQSSGIL